MSKNNWFLKSMAVTLLLPISLAACGAPAPSESSSVESRSVEGSAEAVRLQDDFYTAINQEWLDTTELPKDFPMAQPVIDLNNKISLQVREDMDALLLNRPSDISPEISEFLNLLEMMNDADTRKADGYAALTPYLEKIEKMSSIADLSDNLAYLIENGYPSPFRISVMPDMGNSEKKLLYFDAPTILLPNAYYGTPEGDALLGEHEKMSTNYMMALGYSQKDAAKIAADTIAFDKILLPLMKTPEEASVFTGMYNPVAFSDFSKKHTAVDFTSAVIELTGVNVEEISISNPKYYDALAEILNEENFEIIKSWIISGFAQAYSGFLPYNFQEIVFEYDKLLSGATEMTASEESSYYNAKLFFAEPIGQYYGKKYFGEEAKADVEEMVSLFIDSYEKRINDANWLSAATKEKAILKLDNLIVEVGYPEEIGSQYSKLKTKTTEDGGTLLQNAIEFTRITIKHQYEMFSAPVNRREWYMTGDTVNAQSLAMKNALFFPAGMLQAPYYSLERPDSENYGGIGVVIAHEISHVFDPNGAMYDEKGNIENWWTEEDYAAFEEKIAAVTKQFDGLPFGGGTLNGSLSVTENTADLGGMSCSLEVMELLEEPDHKAFFETWARCWAYKASPQIDQMLLEDVHAPNIYRVNTLLPNFEKFLEAFDIKEGDGMYLDEKDRITVW